MDYPRPWLGDRPPTLPSLDGLRSGWGILRLVWMQRTARLVYSAAMAIP